MGGNKIKSQKEQAKLEKKLKQTEFLISERKKQLEIYE